MADPFDVTSGNDPWRNLMAFGLATMNAGAQPGARTLGAIGQGGLAAMDSARQNALANMQTQLYGAEAQGKLMQNAVSLNQINLQRMAMGQQPLNVPGVPSIAPTAQANDNQNASGVPTGPAAGMPSSSSAGYAPQTYANPTSEKVTGSMVGAPNAVNPQRLLSVAMGQMQPNSPEEAGQAAFYANSMGYADRAQKLNQYALGGGIAGQEAGAKAAAEFPYDIAKINATPTSIPQGGAMMRNGQIIAQGAQDAVNAQGTPYRIPAQMVQQPDQSAPLGVRQNNPGNIRPNGDQWQGATGQSNGYNTFDTPENGIRALSKNLLSYNQQGINTPMAIAAKWAPNGDGNNSAAYGQSLAAMLGVKPDTPLNLADPNVNFAVTNGIIQMENGTNPYSPMQVASGVMGAFGNQQSAPAAQTNSEVPQGAIQTGISPQQKNFAEGRGTALSKRSDDIDEQAQGAKDANFLLGQMQNEAKDFRMGKWADFQADANKYLRVLNPNFDQPVGSYEAFKKNAITLTNEEVRQVSSRAAVQEYKAIQGAQPQPDMSPEGFKQIINQKYAINDYKLARQQARDAWLQNHSTTEGFETEFNKNVTPAIFLMHRMSKDDVEKLCDNLLKQENGQAVLNGLLKKIQYAQQNGLLD